MMIYFQVMIALIRRNVILSDGKYCQRSGCLAARWLTSCSCLASWLLADGEGCWLAPDESGSARVYSSKDKGIPSLT